MMIDVPDSVVAELHDLIVDAAMHDGRVSIPIPLSDELVTFSDTLHDALVAANGGVRQSSMTEMVERNIPAEDILEAALLHIDADLFGQLYRDGDDIARARIDKRIAEVLA